MSLDARTVGEELLGAEIVAGKELTEAAGSAYEAMELGAVLWSQQARWLFEDYTGFLLQSVEKPGDPSGFFALMEARSRHIASGLHSASELMRRECVPATRIWNDFFGTVLRDWRKP